MQMNKKNTNKGGYQESDLREELNSEKILKDFTGLELAPFDNGDLLRLPFYGEMFGHDDWYNSGAVEPDDCAAGYWGASNSLGVRPAFLIKLS